MNVSRAFNKVGSRWRLLYNIRQKMIQGVKWKDSHGCYFHVLGKR